MTTVAAFDCGTNSIRLLIADLDAESGRATELHRDMQIVRLGEGVDRTGRLSDSALQRVFGALEGYLPLLEEHGAAAVRFCATSAARDADNGDAFVAGIRARLGQDPEILDGEEEARLSFLGATGSMQASLPLPHLVVDIGGGSTELILGEQEVESAQSLDVGSVRLTERHLQADPPTREQIEAVRRDVDEALDTTRVPLDRARSVIGVAGTVTTVAAGALRLRTYERQLIHHSVIDVASVQSTVAQLLAMSVEERKALGYMHPGRADVIGAGGIILERVLQRTPARSVLVSEHDILDGIAWSLVGQPRSGDERSQ
jgi:exopolyphosphatase / guanosine-5'-triphosphate,3'-diphosphate pyrophosphatase